MVTVKVDNLTKIYGQQKAVENISFEVNKGEILGFLGPNGAGKTTTMKILTCFIPQSSGLAEVCGFDVKTRPLDVKKHIGYLPEHNPLYKDMYVREYLQFVAGLHKGISPKRADEMVEQTGLTPEAHKKIGQLSKGYRQRVGLAQAMLHDPDVLILDEPTSGLDPNQLVDIRNLIKELGSQKTVIFSTHIMQEVQALCDRVIIINKGKLAVDDQIGHLTERMQGESAVKIEVKGDVNTSTFKEIIGFKRFENKGPDRWVLYAPEGADIRPEIFKWAVRHNLILLEMNKEHISMENVFHQLTINN